MNRRSASLGVAADTANERVRITSGPTAGRRTRPTRGDADAEDAIEGHSVPSLERLVAEAMAMAAATGGDGPELANLLNRFWRLVPDEDLEGRTSAQMLAATQAHLELARQRLPGEMKLRVEQTPDHTAFLVVTDDMPFLVDSVTAAVTAAGLELNLLVHPQLVVVRETLGALVQVRSELEADEAGPGDLVESWMRVEVGVLHDDAAVTALRNDIQ